MFEAIVAGLVALATPQAVLFMLVGVSYGLVIGILPGLGGIVALALLLPFTYGHELAATLALLLGAHIATIWGGSVTSILFKVPGAAKSLALVFDGHPMTQQGHAARALGASATAALLGGLMGTVFLAFSVPIVRPVMLALGPSEYLMMALWGLTIIATFSEGSLLKGLVATCLGIMVAFVGMDPVSGTPRFWFGNVYLLDGISFPVAKAVRRGTSSALLNCDLPYGPLQESPDAAVRAGMRFVEEAGAEMVKLDGAADCPEAVTAMAAAGIAVWAQFGITPHTAARYGIEYRALSTAEVPPDMTERLVSEAKTLEAAGAVMLDFTNSGPIAGPAVAAAVSIPVIGGFGGGPWLDGRVRMVHAAIGYGANHLDEEIETYANVARISLDAITAFGEDVRAARQIRGAASGK